jgi:hypothetical protein
VDRLADDYAILVSPGQPGLRVNASADEAIRYAPRRMDVIDLEANAFATVEVAAFLARWGERLPLVRQLVSLADGDRLHRPVGLLDLTRQRGVVSFEGLLAETPFLARMQALLRVLREKLRTPVDVEFACDGEHVYLLQCRPQSHGRDDAPAPIPVDVPRQRIVFSASRHVSNGAVPDLTHVVYVEPEAYARLSEAEMRAVGRAVGRLNRLLPRRRFVLMGPGRWGCRGDVRLGVPVGYAEISNAALLVEIALKKGGYLPDLSFGTHFFQDLVESQIRYLPLYPDDPDVVFNHEFLAASPNALRSLLPDAAALEPVLRVIVVADASGGQVLRVLANADLGKALGMLCPPASSSS